MLNQLNKKKKRILAGAGAAVLVAALGAGGIGYARNRAANGTVSVYPVSSMGYSEYGQNRSMYGEVTDAARQEVRLGESLVDKVKVKNGDKVKKGDVLMKYNKESVKLTIQSDEASIALIKAEMESAKAEIRKLAGLHPSEEMPEPQEQIIHHRVDPVTTIPVIDVGCTPSEGNNIYYCSLETKVTKEMLQYLDDQDLEAEFRIFGDDVEIASWKVDGRKMSSGTKIIYVIPDPTPTPKPTPGPTPPEPDPEPEPGPTSLGQIQDPTPVTAKITGRAGASAGVLLSVREQTAANEESMPGETRIEEQGPYEDWILGEGLELNGDGTVTVDYSIRQYGKLQSVVPEESEWDEYIIIDPDVNTDNGDYCYSRKELAEMIRDKEKLLKDKELDLKAAELKLKEDKLISSDGKVLASMDGIVTEAKNPAEVKAGEPLITVKGNSGFTITIHVSEYEINDISQGDSFRIMSYETSSFFEAEVTDIRMEPEDGSYLGYYGQNVTCYPVIATVMDPEVELHRGESCEVTREQNEMEAGGSLVIPSMMVRKDAGGSYCMIADENNRLKRVPVQTGRVLWGSEVVIKSGITENDRIAFPYGRYVKEGSPVIDKDNMWDDY